MDENISFTIMSNNTCLHYKNSKVLERQIYLVVSSGIGYNPQTMEIVDLAIHSVVCQKSDFDRNHMAKK